MVPDESFYPEADGAGENGKGYNGNLSGPLTPTARVGPWKEGHNAARSAFRVAEIEMVGGGIVEVDGTLDEPKAKYAGVEVEIALWVARYRRDVMNAGGCKSHGRRGGLRMRSLE